MNKLCACWVKDRRAATKRSTTNFYPSVPKRGKFLQRTEIYHFTDLYKVIFCSSCCNWYICSKSSGNGGNKVYSLQPKIEDATLEITPVQCHTNVGLCMAGFSSTVAWYKGLGLCNTINSLMFTGINVCVFETKPCSQGLIFAVSLHILHVGPC